MALFGKKRKKEETASCCGNCNAESMAQAEQAKTEGASVKILGSGFHRLQLME